MIEVLTQSKGENFIPAVENQCNRCLGHDLTLDANQHKYCQDCAPFYPVSDFMFIKRYKRKRNHKKYTLNLPFDLSDQQLRGQAFIESCYTHKKDGFLHAVCGAGKTEMTLKTILNALEKKASIAFVIPRVQVIKQLVKRFKDYFKRTAICGLYEGQDMDESADIYITTPQQMIRFYREFDFIIIDEADAFPFYQNRYLYRLVDKALKDNGTKVYISATLPKDYHHMIKKNLLNYCLIPRRFHMHDMPVPKFKKYTYIYSQHIRDLLETYHKDNQKLLVYFPSIHLMSRYHYFLNESHIPNRALSSKSIHKNQILRAFMSGDFSILLTTTLLERGVTYPNCHVFVLESDHPVFKQDTLIQIAGRVGRDASYIGGDIVFFSRFVTKAMLGAKQKIVEMNQVIYHDM